MEGAPLKLAFLVVVVVASAPFFTQFTAEARHKSCPHPPKHSHHKHHSHHSHSPAPVPVPAPAPLPSSQSPPPPPESPPSSPEAPPPPSPDQAAPPPYDVGTPGGMSPPGYVAPPYVIHGCGHSCFDDNDCDWPCIYCCANATAPTNTCCYGQTDYDPDFPPVYLAPALSPSSPSPSPTPAVDQSPPQVAPPPYYDVGTPGEIPPPGYVYPPYVTHGCGFPCSDSNDCDWPCTECCANSTASTNTCCYGLTDDYSPPPS